MDFVDSSPPLIHLMYGAVWQCVRFGTAAYFQAAVPLVNLSKGLYFSQYPTCVFGKKTTVIFLTI